MTQRERFKELEKIARQHSFDADWFTSGTYNQISLRASFNRRIKEAIKSELNHSTDKELTIEDVEPSTKYQSLKRDGEQLIEVLLDKGLIDKESINSEFDELLLLTYKVEISRE